MTCSTKLAPKKEGNCNVVGTWPRHMILLIIISNDISLSSPIAFTHCLVPNGSLFWYTKPHSSIVENWLSYIALLGSAPATMLLSSHCRFDSFSPISRLLGLNLSLSGSVRIQIIPWSLAIDEGLQNRISLGWSLHWEDGIFLWSVGARP